MPRHVIICKKSTLFFHKCCNIPCYTSPVKLIAATFNNLLKCICKQRILKYLSFCRSFPSGHVNIFYIRIFLQSSGIPVQIISYDLSHRESFSCIGNGRLEYISHRKPAEHIMHLEPAIYTSGNRYRQRPV